MKIILASTSPYRVQQMRDFGLRFEAIAPPFDEESLKQNKISPRALSRLLARKKAESVAQHFPKACVIGADQLVSLGREILGKPHTKPRAAHMLKKMSGQTHQLITSFCVIYRGKVIIHTVSATIRMRQLSQSEIHAYIKRDRPLNCAGSYKLEKSGLSLIESLRVSDPSSLTGLPMMELMKILLSFKEELPFLKY